MHHKWVLKSHLWCTYDVPQKDNVKEDGMVHEAMVTVMTSLLGDVWSEELALNMFLSECADDVDVHPDPSMQFERKLCDESTSLSFRWKLKVTLR